MRGMCGQGPRARTSERRTAQRAAAAGLEVTALRRQLAAAQAKSAKPKQPARPATPSENVAALQQQLKAARTRVHNLTVEKNAAWRARDEARRANPVNITKAQRAKLLKALHPDKEVSKERKEVLNAALQIFNGLRIRLII